MGTYFYVAPESAGGSSYNDRWCRHSVERTVYAGSTRLVALQLVGRLVALQLVGRLVALQLVARLVALQLVGW